jgi:hypothetical protein
MGLLPYRFRREKPPRERRCYYLGVVMQKLADELLRSCWLPSEHHVRRFGPVEAEALRQFESNVHPVDCGDYLSPYAESTILLTHRNCPAFLLVSESLIRDVRISSMIQERWSSWFAKIYETISWDKS